MYYEMDEKAELLCFNLPIMICEYQESGYTKNLEKQFKENPKGYFKFFQEILGRNIGLISSSKEVTSGVELSHMSEEEFYKTISKARIFCRLKPDQKLKIVNAFYKDGFKVAVEGETLGDLSIISMSNIGIGKAKAPNILKKICDIYTDKSSIKSLLKLKKKGKEVKRAIENASLMYMQFTLAQIFAMYAYYLKMAL